MVTVCKPYGDHMKKFIWEPYCCSKTMNSYEFYHMLPYGAFFAVYYKQKWTIQDYNECSLLILVFQPFKCNKDHLCDVSTESDNRL